jgi:hypothetical protein
VTQLCFDIFLGKMDDIGFWKMTTDLRIIFFRLQPSREKKNHNCQALMMGLP